jgi:hypothetical protein
MVSSSMANNADFQVEQQTMAMKSTLNGNVRPLMMKGIAHDSMSMMIEVNEKTNSNRAMEVFQAEEVIETCLVEMLLLLTFVYCKLVHRIDEN